MKKNRRNTGIKINRAQEKLQRLLLNDALSKASPETIERQLRRSVRRAVQRWMLFHGKIGLTYETEHCTPQDEATIYVARRLTEFELEKYVEDAIQTLKSEAIPLEPEFNGPCVLWKAEAVIQRRVHKLLLEKYRFILRTDNVTNKKSIHLERDQSRDGLRSFGRTSDTASTLFRGEIEEKWSADETTPPRIYGEESASQSVSVVYSGGFETNRRRH